MSPSQMFQGREVAAQTAESLPYGALAQEISALLQDPSVQVPPRLVQPLPHGASLFVMPAHDAHIAMTKLITYTPSNQSKGLPTIQGDVVVFDVHTGTRMALLDGPTVTARRTAAVSLLAAQHLAPVQQGPLLMVGAGVQAWAHAEAFVQGLGVQEVWVNSRRRSSAQMLTAQLDAAGVVTKVVENVQQAVAHCPLIVTCTPARQTVLDVALSSHHFVAAVGAFTPQMAELSPQVCQQAAREGMIVLDTADARHEAGDLIQAQLNILTMPTLQDVVRGTWQKPSRTGCVLFKSCGWAGWDLAAARLAVAQERV